MSQQDPPEQTRDDAEQFSGRKERDLPSRDVTEGAERAPHRAMFRAMGWSGTSPRTIAFAPTMACLPTRAPAVTIES